MGSATLFGTPRCGLLEHLEADLGTLDVLETYGPASDSRLVATFYGKPPKAITARLEALGRLERLTEPTRPQDRALLLGTLATTSGVALPAGGSQLLATRLGADWARSHSVIRQLAMGGFTHPTTAQLEVLLGSATEDEVPWGVTDAAARADRPGALRAAVGLPPVVVSSWVVGESLRLAEALEQCYDAPTAAAALGIHPFRAEKLVRWAARLDPGCRVAVLAAAAHLDLAAKGPEADRAVVAALAGWLAALHPR